jgi:hypothetical protein
VKIDPALVGDRTHSKDGVAFDRDEHRIPRLPDPRGNDSMLRRPCAELLDRAHYLLTLARLTVLDWLTGPPLETPTDRAIRDEGERLRSRFHGSTSAGGDGF